jgi:AraC-like DNA-binding protein
MKEQLAIDFAPGLLEQYATFMDCLRGAAYGCGKQLKAIAADLDMSPSELSRRLSDDAADIPFRARDLEAFIESTQDTRPIQWLVLRYLADASTASERAMRELAALAPTFVALAKAAGVVEPPAKRGR